MAGLQKSLPSFHLINDSVCIRLKLYGEDVKNLLLRNSWKEVNRENADIIFINTCSFLKKVEDKTVSNIKKITENKKKGQQIAVFGCLPAINLSRLKEVHDGLIFSGRNLEEIRKAFDLTNHETKISHIVKRKCSTLSLFNKYMNKIFFRDDYFKYLYEKENVFHLKISEGCLGKCTYCSERFARGCLKSKRVGDIMEQFKEGLKKEFGIFSLNADDTGAFGIDNGENVVTLLEKMLEQEGNYKLVITEFNPFWLLKYSDKLTDLLGSEKVVFITVPVQSGNGVILKNMNRSYDVNKLVSVLTEIRKRNPKIKINTHIIVGFPEETEEQFNDSVRLLERFHFNKIKIFKYSDRPNTVASGMKNKISEEEKEKRFRKLHQKVIFDCIKRLDLKEFLLNENYFF